MKRRTFTIALGAGIAAAALPLPRGDAATALRAASNLPPEHPAAVRTVQMWNDIRRDTNGAVEVKSFPNSILGSDTSMMTQLRSGALDFYMAPGGTLGAVVDVANIEDTGYAFNSSPDAWRAFDGPLGAYIRKQSLAQNIVVFEKMFEGGMRVITTSGKPIRTVDDLQGFKLRVAASKSFVDMFKTFGALPTSLTLNEVYLALQTHLVDGAENALALISTQRFYEVQKALSITNHGWSGYWLLANGDSWGRLPSPVQAAIARNAAKYAMLQRNDTQILNATLVDKMRRIGLTINTAPPDTFRARLKPYYARLKDQYGAQVWSLLESTAGNLS